MSPFHGRYPQPGGGGAGGDGVEGEGGDGGGFCLGISSSLGQITPERHGGADSFE